MTAEHSPSPLKCKHCGALAVERRSWGCTSFTSRNWVSHDPAATPGCRDSVTTYYESADVALSVWNQMNL